MERRTFLTTAVAGLSAAKISRLAAAGSMPMCKLGRTGMTVSHFCLGGFHMRKSGEENGVEMIHRAMDLGVNFFDSAHKYHDGESDVTYGQAFKDSSKTPTSSANEQGAAPHREGSDAAARGYAQAHED